MSIKKIVQTCVCEQNTERVREKSSIEINWKNVFPIRAVRKVKNENR